MVMKQNFCGGFRLPAKKKTTTTKPVVIQGGIYYGPITSLGAIDSYEGRGPSATTYRAKFNPRPTSAVYRFIRSPSRPVTQQSQHKPKHKPNQPSLVNVNVPQPLAFNTSPSDKLVTMFFNGKIPRSPTTVCAPERVQNISV
jgi:hypothetical protein